MIDLAAQRDTLLATVFTVPRLMAALTISPFFGPQFIQGIARQVVIVALTIVAVPLVTLPASPEMLSGTAWPLQLMGVLSKEIAIGLLLGFASGVVFWIAEGVGFFIDNQRGSSMAEIFDPMSGSSSSPFGVLLAKIVGVLFFLGGGFHAFLTVIYESYNAWPVFTYFPQFTNEFPVTCLRMLDAMMSAVVTFAAPLVIAMFLAEFGLGLMNRFSPQLNVFFLAMPVKSGIASVLIIFYLVFLVEFFERYLFTPDKLRLFYHGLFK